MVNFSFLFSGCQIQLTERSCREEFPSKNFCPFIGLLLGNGSLFRSLQYSQSTTLSCRFSASFVLCSCSLCDQLNDIIISYLCAKRISHATNGILPSFNFFPLTVLCSVANGVYENHKIICVHFLR